MAADDEAPGGHPLFDFVVYAVGNDQVHVKFRSSAKARWRTVTLNAYDTKVLGNRALMAANRAFHGAPATFNEKERNK